MAADPYRTLGVNRDASQEDIQKAYRRLAKRLHPDLNPGNKKAEDQFKDVTAAYDLLGDPDKRARFDRGEIDPSGAERAPHGFYRDYAERGGTSNPYTSDAGFADFAGDEDMFAQLFGRGRRANFRMHGQDSVYRLDLDFLDAINGGKRQVTLPDGEALDVTIPPGTHDGQILRLRGKGRPGIGGGTAGDALIEIHVRPHPMFVRKGDDIYIELPISLKEAVLGGKARAPTPSGPVSVNIPKWSNTGSVLRLRGKGVPRPDGGHGDEYVTLKIMLPEKRDPELERFVATWHPVSAPRQAMEA